MNYHDNMNGDAGKSEIVGDNMNKHIVDKTEIDKFIIIWFQIMHFTIWTSLQHLENCPDNDDCEPMNALGNESNQANAGRSIREVLQDKIKKIRYRLRRGITMESGAADNVMPKSMVRNNNCIRPSKGSMSN